jgi:hypothetical protein
MVRVIGGLDLEIADSFFPPPKNDLVDRCYAFAGTFFPALLASERPMAIACFRLVTFFSLRPDLNFPCLISLISVSTFFPTDREYFRPDGSLEAVFFLLPLFVALLDFFFIAIFELLKVQMANSSTQVVGDFKPRDLAKCSEWSSGRAAGQWRSRLGLAAS